MLPVVREYLEQCRQRREEPYYGFIEHAGSGEVTTDLDFAPPHAVRLFAVALLRGSQRQQTKSVAPRAKLLSLGIRFGVNKGKHHPPRQSKRLLPYEALLAQRRPEDTIVAPQCRPMLRSLIDGLQAACAANLCHLTRLELCGLPLAQCSEATGMLFKVLPRCTALRVLKLSKSTLTDQLFTQLATLSESAFPALKEAHFSECGLSDASARGVHSLILLSRGREQSVGWRTSLRRSVHHRDTPPKALEALDISGNRLGDATLKQIGLAIAHDASLQVVDLSRNAVTTVGLTEFLQQGTLQGSAIESFDLSKNLIDVRVDYAVGMGFTCQQTYEEQLLLTRDRGRKPRDSVNTASKMCARLQTAPYQSPRVGPMAAGAGAGEPEATPLPSVTCLSPEQHLATLTHEENSSIKIRALSNPLMCDTSINMTELSILSAAKHEAEGRSGQSGMQVPASTFTLSHDTQHHPSISSRCDGQSSIDRFFPHAEQQQQQQQQQQSCSRMWQDQQQQQQQLGTMPHVLPLVFPPSADQQWCGVPMYIPVPLSSLGAMPMAQQARQVRDVGVGTSSLSEPLRRASSRVSPSLGPLSGLSPHDTTALELVLAEPLQTGELDVAEWKRQEQRFLESLVMRVESHENAMAELMEHKYQATCERLNAMRDELSQHIRRSLEEQRMEQGRLFTKMREEISVQQPPHDAEESISEQLAELIHAGMRRIHDQMLKPDAGVIATANAAAAAASSSSSAAAAATIAASGKDAGQCTQHYLREVKGMMNRLGW